MKEKKKKLLWKMEGATPSHLFGTMHVRDQSAFHHSEALQQAIYACSRYAAEFNLAELPQQLDPAIFNLPRGQLLEDWVGQRRFNKLRALLLRALGMDLSWCNRRKPLVVLNLIDEYLLSRDQPIALDQMLWKLAQRAGKTMSGVETYQEQLAVLQRIPIQHQVKALLALGGNISRYRQQLNHMTQLYQKGEIQQLYQSVRRGAGHTRKTMLFDRNRVMAKRIDRMAREEATFFAIGAGHLGGEKGLIRLLKQYGWRLAPVG